MYIKLYFKQFDSENTFKLYQAETIEAVKIPSEIPKNTMVNYRLDGTDVNSHLYEYYFDAGRTAIKTINFAMEQLNAHYTNKSNKNNIASTTTTRDQRSSSESTVSASDTNDNTMIMCEDIQCDKTHDEILKHLKLAIEKAIICEIRGLRISGLYTFGSFSELDFLKGEEKKLATFKLQDLVTGELPQHRIHK